MSLLSSPSWSETMNDLVERNGLYYQKFINVQFTGKVTGSFKNDERKGNWVSYWGDGQLRAKGNFKNSKTVSCVTWLCEHA